jgi:hypothetical protein
MGGSTTSPRPQLHRFRQDQAAQQLDSPQKAVSKKESRSTACTSIQAVSSEDRKVERQEEGCPSRVKA